MLSDLAPSVERPEDRGGYRHPELCAYLLAKRPTLVAAALTIVRAHVAAGRPSHGLPILGGFGEWDKWVTDLAVLRSSSS